MELLSRADEFKQCTEILEKHINEVYAVRGCAYYIAMAISMELKAFIYLNGLEYPQLNNIQKLLNMIRENTIPIEADLSDLMEDMSDTLSLWTNSEVDFVSFTSRKFNRAKVIYQWLRDKNEQLMCPKGISASSNDFAV